MKQTSFNFLKDYKKEFGGSLLLGKRKSRRPLSTKHPIHLVLKSSGSSHFNPGNRKIELLIKNQAKKYGIQIYDIALSWSHIHMLLKLPSREAYMSFIRTVTALLVGMIAKNKHFTSRKLDKKTFDLRPFTKILTWGKQFKRVLEYHILNTLEAYAMMPKRKSTKRRGKNSRLQPLPPH